MNQKNSEQEMQKVLAQSKMVDTVMLPRLQDLIKKVQSEKDMFRNENKRLSAENARLHSENGNNKIFFFKNYLLDLHMFLFLILYRTLAKMCF